MSDYKRLFSYLYFYQRKIKEKNSGFVKVEIRNNQCRLQLSVKGGFLNQAPQWGVYGFTREDQGLRLWRLGRMNAANGQGEWGGQMPLARFLGEAVDLNHVAGLLLYGSRGKEDSELLPDLEDDGNGLVCATVWDDLSLFIPGETSWEMLHAAQVERPEGQERSEGPEQRIEASMLTEEEPLRPADDEWTRKEKEGRRIKDEEQWHGEEDRQTEAETGQEEALPEKEEPLRAEGAGTMNDAAEEWDTLRELLEEKEVERIMADRTASPESSEYIKRETERQEPCQDEEKNLQSEAKQNQNEENQECARPEPRNPQAENEPVWERESGCPCPEQCIWSDMYQAPPRSLWEKLAAFYPKLILNGMGSDWEVLKIMPRDIGRLPRETWVYGNNSFLLHGYYRHHHLILACYKGTTPHQYYLGVPGFLSDRERVMASMFGFTNYLPGGKRGYWYTPINLGNN